MFALGAAFTKLVSDSLASRGVGGTIGYWPAYALMAVSLAGLVLQQVAFSAGSLPATMSAMTITDPLVSYGLGVGGFGEHAAHGLGPVSLSLAGLGLLGAGIAVLARSPLLQRTAATPGTPAAVVPVPASAVSLPPARSPRAAPGARTGAGQHPVPAWSGVAPPGRAPAPRPPAHTAARRPYLAGPGWRRQMPRGRP
jgi:hypothetical protein